MNPKTFLAKCVQEISNLGELKIVLTLYELTYNPEINKVRPVQISYRQFSNITGLTVTTIQKAVRKAVDNGYIKIVESAKFQANGAAKYVVNLPTVMPVAHGTTEQESLISEILGKKKEEEPKKKRLTKAAKRRKNPEINPQDLLTRFRVKFENTYKCSYGNMSKIEISKSQQLLEWYTWSEVKMMIDWFFLNYDKDSAFPTDPPNFHIFHGWRDHIHGKAVIGDIHKSHKNDSIMTGREAEFSTDSSDAGWDSVKINTEDHYSESWG